MTGRTLAERRNVVARLLAERGDTLLVTGLGAATWDAAAAGDDARNFYLWGGMGGAAACGLGLALARPRQRVLVLTGDGEMLMGLGSLATIAVQRVRNLAIVVLDNERYGETGSQKTHTAHGVDLAGMAAAAGFATTCTVETGSRLDAGLELARHGRGPVMVVVKVAPDNPPLVAPPRDGALLARRFRDALATGGPGSTRRT